MPARGEDDGRRTTDNGYPFIINNISYAFSFCIIKIASEKKTFNISYYTAGNTAWYEGT